MKQSQPAPTGAALPPPAAATAPAKKVKRPMPAAQKKKLSEAKIASNLAKKAAGIPITTAVPRPVLAQQLAPQPDPLGALLQWTSQQIAQEMATCDRQLAQSNERRKALEHFAQMGQERENSGPANQQPRTSSAGGIIGGEFGR